MMDYQFPRACEAQRLAEKAHRNAGIALALICFTLALQVLALLLKLINP